MRGRPFSTDQTPYARLVANVVEDGECWLGTERKRSSYGYPRLNFRVPGLGGRHVALTAHIAVYVWLASSATTLDELWLAYWEFRCSGLEIDHTCERPACRRPGHLDPVTRTENEQRKRDRRAARAAMRSQCEQPEDEPAVEF